MNCKHLTTLEAGKVGAFGWLLYKSSKKCSRMQSCLMKWVSWQNQTCLNCNQKVMKIFKVTFFCGGTGGGTNPTKCWMTSTRDEQAEALRCVHEHVSECHYGSRPWVCLILRMIGFLELKKIASALEGPCSSRKLFTAWVFYGGRSGLRKIDSNFITAMGGRKHVKH